MVFECLVGVARARNGLRPSKLAGGRSRLALIVVAICIASACGNVAVGQPASSPNASGITRVEPPEQLVSLIRNGSVPSNLEQLLALEKQQQQIAKRAADCTVNIQINGHETGSTQGCGVIITDDGYVLTAAHVAERPGLKVKLTLNDGRAVSARTLGMNRGVDAGLIKIDSGQNDGQPWRHASLGTSVNLRPGMWCVATGHPGGYDQERGPVTRVGRILQVREGAITTDCALIGGDSGGPLFDLEGKLIAVHSRIGNDVADNLHVPVDHYDEHWDRLANGEAWGYLPGFRPVLGVTGQPDLEEARIVQVRPGSPAESAGDRKSTTSELPSLRRTSYAVFCLKKKK